MLNFIHGDRNKDRMIALVVFSIALFIGTFRTHSEFRGDDDYRWNRRYVNYTLWDLKPDCIRVECCGQWVRTNLNILFGDLHGPGVGLIYGPIIGLFAILGFPISKMIHLHKRLDGIIFMFAILFPVASIQSGSNFCILRFIVADFNTNLCIQYERQCNHLACCYSFNADSFFNFTKEPLTG